jgi:hypothetical protein
MRPWLLVAVVLAFGTGALGARDAGGAGRSNSVTYGDPVGDARGAAADVRSITVSSDASRVVTIAIDFANRPAFLDGDAVIVGLDTDQDGRTGSFFGDEYEIRATRDHGADSVRLCNERVAADDCPQRPWLRASLEGPRSTFAFPAGELGIAGGFRFHLVTIWDDCVDCVDIVPEQTRVGLLNFQLDAGTTPPRRPVALRVDSVSVNGEPFYDGQSLPPGTLRLEAAVWNRTAGIWLVKGRVSCAATDGSRRLRAAVHRFVHASPTCGWYLPKWTRGTTVRLGMRVTVDGASANVTRKVKVR